MADPEATHLQPMYSSDFLLQRFGDQLMLFDSCQPLESLACNSNRKE